MRKLHFKTKFLAPELTDDLYFILYYHAKHAASNQAY